MSESFIHSFHKDVCGAYCVPGPYHILRIKKEEGPSSIQQGLEGSGGVERIRKNRKRHYSLGATAQTMVPCETGQVRWARVRRSLYVLRSLGSPAQILSKGNDMIGSEFRKEGSGTEGRQGRQLQVDSASRHVPSGPHGRLAFTASTVLATVHCS